MLNHSNISIRNKLILIQVFTSVLVLGVFLVVFIFTDIRNYKRHNAENMQSLAQIIGINSIPAIQFQDAEAARQILVRLQTGSPSITHAMIIDTTGKPFAEYTRRDISSLDSSFISLNGESYLYKNDRLYVESIIKDNTNQVFGKVFIETEHEELDEMLASKLQVAGTLIFFALLFSLLVATIMQSYIFKRLLKLVNTMKEVGKAGKYDKTINDTGRDEISLLINGFNELMQKVEENQQRKDEFIGIASHELKTPLTTVKGYIDLLNIKLQDETLRQYTQRATDNVNKLEKLIRELLDVSKIQSGQMQLSPEEFSLAGLLDETISAIQMVTDSHRIIKEYENIPETVFADRHRIEQVLINLLTNAIKYSPGNDHIIISLYKTYQSLVIKIRDFGKGIPKNEQKSVFERFYRSKDTSARIAGFGLGLYISKDIINRHQGEIWVESDTNGSAFFFSLPIFKKQTADDNKPTNHTLIKKSAE